MYYEQMRSGDIIRSGNTSVYTLRFVKEQFSELVCSESGGSTAEELFGKKHQHVSASDTSIYS